MTQHGFRGRGSILVVLASLCALHGMFTGGSLAACPANDHERLEVSEPELQEDASSESDDTGTRVFTDILYGSNRAYHRLNLLLPETVDGPVPLVVWIHGGAWISGDKDGPNPAAILLEKGFAVASIEYRPATIAAYPAQFKDCQAAVQFLRSKAKRYNIDPDRIGVWGSSAGGHLASMLGVKSVGDRNRARVQAVCDWCGPADLVNAVSDAPADCPLNTSEMLWQLFLGPSASNKRLRQTMSDAQKRKIVASGSPIEFVTGSEPPFLIVHGDSDKTIPLIQSQRFADALSSAGTNVSLEVIAGAGHQLGDRTECLEKSVAFFERTLLSTAESRTEPVAVMHIEAEGGTFTGETRSVEHPQASGGVKVGFIDTDDSSVTFDVQVVVGGTYTLTVQFGNGSTSGDAASHLLTVNDQSPLEIEYAVTGWDNWQGTEVQIELNAGQNTLRFSKGQSFGELDFIELVPDRGATGESP